jgi:acyl-coenzyme A synthetase/AMP-(fatty) acid ligase
MSAVPFLSHRRPQDVVARCGGRAVSVAEFLADAHHLARLLPARAHLVNFCGDRYRFTVGLAAALMRGQVSLLPPSQAPEMLRQLQGEYPGFYALIDAPAGDLPIETVRYPDAAQGQGASLTVPAFPEEQIAVVAFTSGSTGRPSPNPKSWGAIARGAIAEAHSLGLEMSGATFVGTVPPQHMYGLESTVLIAIRNGLALHAAKPLYPADVCAAIEDVPGRRVLVTTPVHLRALLAGDSTLPKVDLIVCATAPLSLALAKLAEERFRAPLKEVYGFTEAGQVATRRTVQGPEWQTMPGVSLERDGDTVLVQGGHVEHRVAFPDAIELRDRTTFVLAGRNADLVNIAGKRSSLTYLNHQLNEIEGVRDGAFFMPDDDGKGVVRLTAFVVAPGVSRESVFDALRRRIDAAFLPRPLHFVEALPRNATGKLPRDALCELARACAERTHRVGATTRIAPDHPSTAGHFPGNPIVPGAVLLDEIVAAGSGLFAWLRDGFTLDRVKFLRPVRPGEELNFTFASRSGTEMRFECRVGEELAVSGTAKAVTARQETAT